jgi:hypothetical protein
VEKIRQHTVREWSIINVHFMSESNLKVS